VSIARHETLRVAVSRTRFTQMKIPAHRPAILTAIVSALCLSPVWLPGANPPASPAPASAEIAPGSKDPAALYADGLNYLKGSGVAKDEKRALELFRGAAEGGHADAIGMIGYFYSAGLVVEKDEKAARRYFTEAAEKGSASAQLNLGVSLLYGRGEEKDPQRAVAWIEKAAAQGSMQARMALGGIFLFGEHANGTPDRKRAYDVLISAAEAGNPSAQNMIGVIVRDGGLGKRDPAAARPWFEKAALQGEAKACTNLGFHFGRDVGNLLGNDPKDRGQRIEALKWLMAAKALNELTGKKYLEDVSVLRPADEMEAARKLADEFIQSLPKPR
jgi:TPR repeat protein